MGDSLGDRMKQYYEDRYRISLTRRTPAILRLDGRAFHTLTRGAEKPFDRNFMDVMRNTALHIHESIQGAKLTYVQSDEISVLITDYDTFATSAWFEYNIQKMCSIAAAEASVKFNKLVQGTKFDKGAVFDCRVFNIPKEDVINYFRWRYQDWTRNSIQMLSRAHFSQKQLHKKNTADMHEMLHGVGVNWANLDPICKNGTLIYKPPFRAMVVDDKYDPEAGCSQSYMDDHTLVVTHDFNLMDEHHMKLVNELLEPKEK